MPNVENHKELVPFEHYTGLFEKLDPIEAAERCGVKYDQDKQEFTLRLFYVDYQISWPKFSIRSEARDGTGAFLPYREMPWGEVYLKPFTGRCLNRAAFTFGTRLDAFRAAAAQTPAIPLDKGDASYQLEVMPGYDVRLIVWEGDDEFPPNSQILFSDNFPQAFSAEDRTVVGDILISDLKRRM